MRRPESALPFVSSMPDAGPPLLLDTTVYIDVTQRRAPSPMKDLLIRQALNHSTVALADLTHAFGRLDPAHPESRATLAGLTAVIDAMSPHRLSTPSPHAFAEAGMRAGLAARLTGRPHTPARLDDALLLLQAAENGWVLLTRNVRDFDVLQQLAPEGRAMLYRAV